MASLSSDHSQSGKQEPGTHGVPLQLRRHFPEYLANQNNGAPGNASAKKNRSLAFHPDLRHFFRPVLHNDAFQLAPDEFDLRSTGCQSVVRGSLPQAAFSSSACRSEPSPQVALHLSKNSYQTDMTTIVLENGQITISKKLRLSSVSQPERCWISWASRSRSA